MGELLFKSSTFRMHSPFDNIDSLMNVVFPLIDLCVNKNFDMPCLMVGFVFVH